MKKIFSVILCFVLMSCACSGANDNTQDLINKTTSYLKTTVTAPTPGAVGGDWTVMSLSGNQPNTHSEYFENYISNTKKLLDEKNGVLHSRKHTEYSRVALALFLLKENPSSFFGYNVTKPLYDFDKTVMQGLNGAIWALIALNLTDSDNDICTKYIDYIVENHIPNSGFSLTPNTGADTDITAMTLVALAPYKNDTKIKKVIDSSLTFLSSVQNGNGSYSSYGTENSESCAQVISALCALDIPVDDSRFSKNGNTVLKALLAFKNDDGSFSHTINSGANIMATEQALYALTSLCRFENNQPHIFAKPPSYSPPVLKYTEKTFPDIKSHKNRVAIETLSRYGIINGMEDMLFHPDEEVTRAQFSAIVVNALSLHSKGTVPFTDVESTGWYYPYITALYHYKIANGISSTHFMPENTITKEESAVMIAKVCSLLKMDTYTLSPETLHPFPDADQVSQWAVNSVAFCYENSLFDKNENIIDPKAKISRADVAQLVYNMLMEVNYI